MSFSFLTFNQKSSDILFTFIDYWTNIKIHSLHIFIFTFQ